MKKEIEDLYWKCYRAVRDVISPVWYRMFGYKHHIIKTDLTPSVWYDTDSRILYGVMECVKWYVENDMQTWTEEEFEEELERMSNEKHEWVKSGIQQFKRQYARDKLVMRIYKWWMDYDNRTNEIEKALDEWAVCLYIDPKDKVDMNEEERAKYENLAEKHTKLEKKLAKEEQQMLKSAIELRGCMWS